MQLIAPMRRASGSILSTMSSAACLCGMVRLQPEKPSAGRARKAAEALRRNGKRQVGAGKPVLGEPIIVQARRARMHHRPAHHAGEQEAVRFRPHPSRRIAARSAAMLLRMRAKS